MRSIVIIFSTFLLMTGFIFLNDVRAGEKEKGIYGGVASCKACHLTKKSGAQYKIWKAGPHAKAFEVLKSDEAKAAGKKLGVDDPSTSEKCLKCHVTASGVAAELKGKKYTAEEGVGCESCHGAGSEYKARKVMKAISAGKVDGSTLGLIAPTKEVCVTCHNSESPTFKDFKFDEFAAKIAHPVPPAAIKK